MILTKNEVISILKNRLICTDSDISGCCKYFDKFGSCDECPFLYGSGTVGEYLYTLKFCIEFLENH